MPECTKDDLSVGDDRKKKRRKLKKRAKTMKMTGNEEAEESWDI